MHKLAIGILAAALSVTCGFANEAHAQRRGRSAAAPAGLSVAGLLGGTVDMQDRGVNPYGLGLGGRLGYTLRDLPFYFGGRLNLNLGSSRSYLGVSGSVWSWLLGGEVGYDIAAGPVIVRPYLGLGLANFHYSGGGYGIGRSGSENEIYLAPSVAVLVPMGSSLFIGGDLNLLFVGGNAPNGLGLFFTIGTYFGS